MQQSNVIFGALTVAFIVFVTLRGELPEYLSLLRGSSSLASASGSAGGASLGDTVDNTAKGFLSGVSSMIGDIPNHLLPSTMTTPLSGYTNSDGSLNPRAALKYLYGE